MVGNGPAQARRLRAGTRGSALARAQAELVVHALRDRFPGLTIELVPIRSQGDIDRTSPLTVIGGQGVFTSALEAALLAGEIDFAIHSAKDLPSDTPSGLELVFPLAREDVRDALVSRHGVGLTELPAAPRIGTSSRRRAAQIELLRPDAEIVELRGNIDTRLRKAASGDYDAIVLAAAGLHRMGWQDRITEYLPIEQLLPAPGQGALAVETRADDAPLLAILRQLEDPAVAAAVRVERAFLRALGVGCAQPIAAYAVPAEGGIRFQAMLAANDNAIERVDVLLPAVAAERGATKLARQMARVLTAPARPLTGWSVLVTRPAAQAEPLVAALRAAGAEPIVMPSIRIEPPSVVSVLDAAVKRLGDGEYDWVVFTSSNGVDAVLERLAAAALTPHPPLPPSQASLHRREESPNSRRGGLFVPSPRVGRGSPRSGGVRADSPPSGSAGAARVAAVGPGTASRLAAAGVGVDLVPERHDGEGLLEALLAMGVAGQRILLPRADRAGDALPAGLRQAGAVVDDVVAYRTVPVKRVDPAVLARLRRQEIDAVTFASGSGVRGLLAQLGDERDLLGDVAVVCIGSATAAAARGAGLTIDVVAEEQSVDGLVAAVLAARQQGVALS